MREHVAIGCNFFSLPISRKREGGPTNLTLIDINDFIFVIQSQSSFLGFFYTAFSWDIDTMNSLLQKMCMIRTPQRFATKINDLKDIVEDHIAGLELVSLISIVYTY